MGRNADIYRVDRFTGMAVSSHQMTDGIPWLAGARLILERESATSAQSSSNLGEAVRKFWAAEWELQSTATLLVDSEIALDGQPPKSAFYGDEIDAFVRRLTP